MYGFGEQAAHVDGFIRALSPGRPVVLVGHSMGGGIAALVAARHPREIAAVALLAIGALGLSWLQIRPQQDMRWIVLLLPLHLALLAALRRR